MKSARLTAFELLYDIQQRNAYSNLALDGRIKNLSPRDKTLATQLVYGVTERRLTLDYLLSLFLTERPKPKVRILLYLGLYQLYFTDKIPSPAAISECVSLSREVGCAYYSKLINAVLRRADRERIDINALDDLSLRYSCPEMLINLWRKQYGHAQTMQILDSINGRAPVFAVPNTLYVDAEELQYELLDEGTDCEVCGDLVLITGAIDIIASKAFQNGLFHIEDASAYQCAKALGVREGDVVLDLCAAPGGKTFTVAEQLHNTGTVYAFDIYEHKADLIRKGAVRLGLTNVRVGINDASVYNEQMPLADKVLCDVPCSGFGIIRRKPEIRYKTLDSVKELPARQLQILSTAARYLKDGGTLVYATCTLNRKENEKVAEAFLQQYPHFDLQEMHTLFPSTDGGDGFFYAVFRLTNNIYD